MKSVTRTMIAVAILTAASATAFAQSSPTADKATQKVEKQQTRHANGKLVKNVRKQMNKDGVDITNVVVLIKGNRVVVTGTVPEASQIELATKAATKVAGDREVDAKLLGVAAAGR